jgi:glutamyl-tRNA reductase
LASRWGAESSTFESLEKSLAETDILISSTGAPHTLVSAEMVRTAYRTRPLVLIDIAVPRDIDPACADLPLVQLFDMDSLNAHLEESMAERAAEVPQARRILAKEEARFGEFLHSLEMLPLITTMRQQAEEIRQTELEKTLRRMPHLSAEERERIEAMTQALVKKLLESPTRRLRAEAACPYAPEYATVARTLFGLEHGDGLCGFSGSPCLLPPAAD